MKIKFFVISIYFCCITGFFQNSAYAFDFSMGPKFGFGSGFFTGKDWNDILDSENADNSAVISFSIGLSLDITFFQGDIFGIGFQPEFLYLYTGGSWESTYYAADFNFNTLEIPMYLKSRFNVKKGYFLILAGPDILLSLDGKYSGEKLQEGFSLTDKYHTDRDYSVGISVGLGYEITLGIGKLQVGITYSTYFIGFGEGDKMFKKIYNNIIHYNVAYSFFIVKPK